MGGAPWPQEKPREGHLAGFSRPGSRYEARCESSRLGVDHRIFGDFELNLHCTGIWFASSLGRSARGSVRYRIGSRAVQDPPGHRCRPQHRSHLRGRLRKQPHGRVQRFGLVRQGVGLGSRTPARPHCSRCTGASACPMVACPLTAACRNSIAKATSCSCSAAKSTRPSR
jgi:hypothetical protein